MALTLASSRLHVTIEPDRGGEITSIRVPGGGNVLSYFDWSAPLADGPSFGSTEKDWLARYRAGWQFLFPNSGAESEWGGIPVAFHGEASLAPVAVIEHESNALTVRTGARLPLELTRTLQVSDDAPTVFIKESVTNVGATEVPFLWGHHPAFPAIPEAVIDLPVAGFEVEAATPGNLKPARGIWPIAVDASTGGDVDVSVVPADVMVRLLDVDYLREGWAALRNPVGSHGPGIAMSWDLEAYPELWIWLQNGHPDFPWYGRARMIGIEPQRYHPFDGLAGAVQRDQAVILQPGETATSWLTLSVLTEHRPVTGMNRLGEVSHD